MKYLNTRRMLQVLKPLCGENTLLVFDFDGTLAPITLHRAHAVMPRSTSVLFKHLASRATTAVISGRSMSDLRMRLKVHPDYLAGNHGLEGLLDNAALLHAAQRLCTAWHRQLKNILSRIPADGIDLENKRYSLSIHYRLASDARRARRTIMAALAKLHPAPQWMPGKKVINVLPPGAPDKGVALLQLIRRARAERALFIGDDDTDEMVFALDDPRIITVRVGRKHSSGAHYYLRRQSEIDAVLRYLVACLDRRERAG